MIKRLGNDPGEAYRTLQQERVSDCHCLDGGRESWPTIAERQVRRLAERTRRLYFRRVDEDATPAVLSPHMLTSRARGRLADFARGSEDGTGICISYPRRFQGPRHMMEVDDARSR